MCAGVEYIEQGVGRGGVELIYLWGILFFALSTLYGVCGVKSAVQRH